MFHVVRAPAVAELVMCVTQAYLLYYRLGQCRCTMTAWNQATMWNTSHSHATSPPMSCTSTVSRWVSAMILCTFVCLVDATANENAGNLVGIRYEPDAGVPSTTIVATDPLIQWRGRTRTSVVNDSSPGSDVSFDWPGVQWRVRVFNASMLHANIVRHAGSVRVLVDGMSSATKTYVLASGLNTNAVHEVEVCQISEPVYVHHIWSTPEHRTARTEASIPSVASPSLYQVEAPTLHLRRTNPPLHL